MGNFAGASSQLPFPVSRSTENLAKLCASFSSFSVVKMISGNVLDLSELESKIFTTFTLDTTEEFLFFVLGGRFEHSLFDLLLLFRSSRTFFLLLLLQGNKEGPILSSLMHARIGYRCFFVEVKLITLQYESAHGGLQLSLVLLEVVLREIAFLYF